MRSKRFAEFRVGQTAKLEKRVTDLDIRQFAALSGDHNPLHLDAVYAAGTLFQGRIAHGMLSAALISAVIGTQLPGTGAIYLAQNLKFLAPVYVDDLVTASVTVAELVPEKDILVLDCVVKVGDRTVLSGEATVLFDPENTHGRRQDQRRREDQIEGQLA